MEQILSEIYSRVFVGEETRKSAEDPFFYLW